MGKINIIPVDPSRRDQGTLPLSINVATRGFSEGDTLELAAGQQLVEKNVTINGVDRQFRAVPCLLNGEVVELSANALFGTRYTSVENAEHVEEDLYRMEWHDFYRTARLRFPSMAAVARTKSVDNKTFVDVIADCAIKMNNVGDVLIYDFKKTLEDDTKVINKQGKEVRKYVYLRKVSDYIAE